MSLKTAIAKVSNTETLPSSKIETAAAAGFYCSKRAETDDDKKAIFNASAGADKSLRDAVNLPIMLKDIYIEAVELTRKDENGVVEYMTNESGEPILDETGEPLAKTDICPRIILFDTDGTTYGCVSYGIYNSLKKLCNLLGTPDTWKEPVKIIPYIVSRGKNQILSLKLG